MKLIQLTQGQVAKVSDDWFEVLNKHKWCATYVPSMNSFYAVRQPSRSLGKRKLIYMHRVIANTPDGMETDHRDGDTLNNQTDNLRNSTHLQNMFNQGKYATNTSGFKGVFASANRKKWRAQIRVNGKSIHIDVFSTREEAARAYDEAAKEYFGEFAQLNFP